METIRNSFIGIRQAIKRFYSLYGIYIDILVKLAVAYAAFSYMNQYFPGRSFLLRPIVTIAVALLCSVLPWNYITLISAFWLLLQVSAISLEVTVFLFIILLVLALLRYLLLPGVGIALVLLPLCFLWKIPFVIPVIVGLAGTVSGFITVPPLNNISLVSNFISFPNPLFFIVFISSTFLFVIINYIHPIAFELVFFFFKFNF